MVRSYPNDEEYAVSLFSIKGEHRRDNVLPAARAVWGSDSLLDASVFPRQNIPAQLLRRPPVISPINWGERSPLGEDRLKVRCNEIASKDRLLQPTDFACQGRFGSKFVSKSWKAVYKHYVLVGTPFRILILGHVRPSGDPTYIRSLRARPFPQALCKPSKSNSQERISLGEALLDGAFLSRSEPPPPVI
ncbi:hypothetical protein HPB47_003723, partial [Ixodes persulcatus]